jgi:ankyrin repeat protein
MHEAASLGFSEVVEILIKARADINARDINSFTPLGYARRSGGQEVIELLERYDASL